MTRRAAQVPGANASESTAIDPTARKGSEANPLTDADSAADLAGTPRQPADETLEQKVARLEAENEGLKAKDAAQSKADADAMNEKVSLEPGQLRASDVDPTKLKRAVLTLDGWVCPATSPAPPSKE